ncbi:MAG: DUF1566 domain-containing protein [Desulfococcaceae bacterium]
MNDNPLQQLTYIITHYGRSVIDDPRRCEALLRDLCPEQRREVNVLVSALKEGVPHDLISMNRSMPEELTLSRLRKRLYDDLGMAEDFAHWAVETWGLALGMVKQRTALSASAKPAPAITHLVQAAPVRISPPPKSRPSVQLRSQPLTVSENDFKKVFQLDDNQRPKKYIRNDYADNGNGTVTDRATGLTWEQSGSKESVIYDKAPEYINGLNRRKFAGYSDWRLPTVEELLSLMEKEEQSNDLYIQTVFDKKQGWCWSADKRPSGGAWLVGFNGGDVFWDDPDYSDWVRGVRS